MYNKQLIDILKLLDLKILIKDGDYYLLDKDNNPSIILKNEKNYLSNFIKDGITYHIVFNDKFISIINENNEKVSISNNELSYQKKQENSRYNDSFVIINSTYASFYDHYDDDYNTSMAIKFYYDDKYMEKSLTINNNDEYKEDIKVGYVDNVPTINHRVRKYDNMGKLVIGTSFDEVLDMSVEDYINYEINNDEIVQNSLNKINNIIPGIIDYSLCNNELFNLIDNKKSI